MTAGKNQAQPVVFKAEILKTVFCIGHLRRTRLRFEMPREFVLRCIESCASTQSVNGFESSCRNQPWSRVVGYTIPRPQAEGSRKGFVHRLLGKIEITEQADQSCQDSSRIPAIKRVEQFAYSVLVLLGGTLRHRRLGYDALGHEEDLSKPAIPNQFRMADQIKLRGLNSFMRSVEVYRGAIRKFPPDFPFWTAPKAPSS